jgi:hypothetical protein
MVIGDNQQNQQLHTIIDDYFANIQSNLAELQINNVSSRSNLSVQTNNSVFLPTICLPNNNSLYGELRGCKIDLLEYWYQQIFTKVNLIKLFIK